MLKMWCIVAYLLFFTSTILDASQAATKQPHIVFVLADDLGWNDVGYHGSMIRTPTLDHLAAEGVKLESYYVQQLCTPSRSQLMSGRHEIYTGLQHDVITPGQPSGLPLSLPILPQILRKAGYATHAVGKWHLGYFKQEYTPTYRGFDSFYGFYNGLISYFSMEVASDIPECYGEIGFDFYDGSEILHTVRGNYTTELYTSRAKRIIRNHNVSQPLFLYLPYQNVHDPNEVPEKYLNQYEGLINNPQRRLKAGMMTALDEAVRSVTIELKEAGIWNNTIFIFSSDNGAYVDGGSNYPLRGWKGSLWEGGIRGVGFVHSPLLPRHRQGDTVSDLLHISDWFPTIINLAAGSLEGLQFDGYDIWKVICDGTESPRKEILHTIDQLTKPKGHLLDPGLFNNTIKSAIRVGDWKLLTGNVGDGSRSPSDVEWNEDNDRKSDQATDTDQWHSPIQRLIDILHERGNKEKNLWLFNIKEDPYEYNDLSSQHTDIVRNLLGRLQAYNSMAVEPWYPEGDPRACPNLHGGNWVPWM